MHSYHKEATVGLLVLLGLFGFVAGTLWLRGKAFGNPPMVHVAYHDVRTLKEGSPVRVSGALIGQVEAIQLEAPGRVIVSFTYDDALVTPTVTATAQLVAVGMLGDMAIEFDPGHGAPLSPDQVIEGSAATGLLDVGADLAGRATTTLDRLNGMLDTSLVVDLRNTLHASEQLLHYLADRHEGPMAEVNTTMRQLQAVSARFDTTMAGIDAPALATRVDSTLRSTEQLTTRLAAMSARMDSLLGRINRGEGSLGKLVADSTLYVELRETLRATRALVDTISAHPERVGITVRVF